MLLREVTSRKAEKIAGTIDTVLIPIGTLESHGPHLSVMTDDIIVDRLAAQVEKLAGDRLLIGPTIPYGHTWHMKDQPGSHDVPWDTLSDYVFEVIRGFKSWKIKHAVLLNGHGGNDEPLHYAAERASDEGITSIVLSWYNGKIFMDALGRIVEDTQISHGGEAETSFVWFADEHCVDMSAIPQGEHRSSMDMVGLFDVYDQNVNRQVFPNSFNGKPSASTADKGRKLYEVLAPIIVQVIDSFRSGKLVNTD